MKSISALTPAWLSKRGVADHYNVSSRTVANWMQKKVIPFIRVGRVVRFNLRQVEAALGAFEVRPR